MSQKFKTMLNFLKIAILTIFVHSGISCKNSNRNVVEVDFSEKNQQSSEAELADTTQSIHVVVAAMISPKETFIYYEELFNYISEKLKVKIELKQKPTYREVNNLLASNEVDIAFLCSGAYLDISNQVDLLVVPVCNGKPYYQAFVIAHKESGVKTFADFKGKSFAYTDELSNTGKLYADKRVKDLGQTPEKFFKSTLYSSSHDISIQMVTKKLVHGASVDGLIFNYLKKHQPKKVENIQVIEKSEYFGIPPIVSSKKMAPILKEKFRDMFLNINNDPEGKKILEKLLIERFIVVDDTLYNSIRKNHEFVSR